MVNLSRLKDRMVRGKRPVMNQVIAVFDQELGDRLLVTREPGATKFQRRSAA